METPHWLDEYFWQALEDTCNGLSSEEAYTVFIGNVSILSRDDFRKLLALDPLLRSLMN